MAKQSKVDVPRLQAWIAETKKRYPDNPPPGPVRAYAGVTLAMLRDEADRVRNEWNVEHMDAFLRDAIAIAGTEWHLPPDAVWRMSVWEYEAMLERHERKHAGAPPASAPTHRPTAPKGETGRTRQRATLAQDPIKRWLAKSYPGGVPDQASKPDAVLQKELVQAGIRAPGGKGAPSISSIRRATGRRKPPGRRDRGA